MTARRSKFIQGVQSPRTVVHGDMLDGGRCCCADRDGLRGRVQDCDVLERSGSLEPDDICEVLANLKPRMRRTSRRDEAWRLRRSFLDRPSTMGRFPENAKNCQ